MQFERHIVANENTNSDIEPGNAATNENTQSIEICHDYCDVSDLKVQTSLIIRFFEKQYPDMPLDDPDTRNLAANLWIGDLNSTTSLAAQFRKYVDRLQQNEHVIDLNNKQSLDAILDVVTDTLSA